VFFLTAEKFQTALENGPGKSPVYAGASIFPPLFRPSPFSGPIEDYRNFVTIEIKSILKYFLNEMITSVISTPLSIVINVFEAFV
jgi:ABC-type glycerol-3-phosphate transport system permease component